MTVYAGVIGLHRWCPVLDGMLGETFPRVCSRCMLREDNPAAALPCDAVAERIASRDHRTADHGAPSERAMSNDHEYLLHLTLYRDGTIRLDAPKLLPGELGSVLRTLADAADAGALHLTEHDDH